MTRFALSGRNLLLVTALGVGAAGAVATSMMTASSPARAQFAVFDAGNYSQNLLTAARTLQQINNQIQSLQNEAQMLINQSKNLTRIDFPELEHITDTLRQIDVLMGKAQGLDFRIDGLDDQFRKLFPDQFNTALTRDQQVRNARARLDTAMASFRQTMGIQSHVVENVATDAGILSALISRSQGAEGALQAQQATNQLLALVAKQQFQIQNLMAAQYRAETTETARRAQDSLEAQGRTRKFLGSGSAYTPK